MTPPPTVTTRGERIRHARLALAPFLGNVSMARMGALIAAELPGKPAPFHASSVKAWEEGKEVSAPVARAIATVAWRAGLEWASPRWVLFGADDWGDEGPPPPLPVEPEEPDGGYPDPGRVSRGSFVPEPGSKEEKAAAGLPRRGKSA